MISGSGSVGQTLDTDIAEGDGISVARKPEETGFAILTGVRTATHKLRDFCHIRIEDKVAVQLDPDGAAVDGDFLEVPRSGRSQKATFCGGHAVDRTVVLTWVQFGVVGMFRIENLQFAHGVVGRVTLAIRANGEAVVARRSSWSRA